VDINMYLQKISAAFRRYVLNTLAKLDASDETENTAVDANAQREGPSSASPSSSVAAAKTPARVPGSAGVSTPQTAADQSPAHTPAVSEYSSARSTPLTAHSIATPGTAATGAYRQSTAYTPSTYAANKVPRLFPS
jgi:hypothetical protein